VGESGLRKKMQRVKFTLPHSKIDKDVEESNMSCAKVTLPDR